MSHSLFIYPLLKSEHTIRKLLVYMLRHFRIMMKQNITQESIKPLIDVHKDIMCLIFSFVHLYKFSRD